MTRELDNQKWVIEAVQSVGGFGHKMNNRFMVGVPDLYIKLPKFQGSFFECKVAPLPKRENTPITLKVTPLQERFLRRAQRAGTDAGVISFVEFRDQIPMVGLAIKGIEYWPERNDENEDDRPFALPQAEHRGAPKRDRTALILDQLKRYYMGDRRVG